MASIEATSNRKGVLKLNMLQATGLQFSYGVQPIIKGVSLTLAPGEVVALLGPNGSGKSTLIRLLLGHLHGEGAIDWEGKAIKKWSRRDLARRIAYLPQSPLFEPDQTVEESLRLGRAPYWGAFGLEAESDVKVVQQVSATLGLDSLLERRMDELSGGQRQRVFIGRCLAQQPAALLLDEPNTFLDLKHQVDLCRLLQNLAKENPQVRRALIAILNTSSWGAVIAATAPLVLTIAANHDLLPNTGPMSGLVAAMGGTPGAGADSPASPVV